MKNIKMLLWLMTVLITGFLSCSPANKISDQVVANKIKTMVENKNFTIKVNQMNPMSGMNQQLTSDYSVTIRHDSVFSHLPYFGRAYSAPYGGGNGLTFEAVINDYQSILVKKGILKISFKTKTDEDSFRYYIDIFENKSTDIRVISVNRQSISYYGELMVED